ncbi:MAG: MetQ/NlpA family ABC transporter substrate-binding protein [Spirochaetia bacterium]|jgi:NitT/TauT family transport system substrate-binding protein
MKTRLIPLIAACALLAPGPACADLEIGLMPAYNSIPLVVADAKGLYKANGLTVQLVPFTGQLERETALQTGAIDGTVTDLINAIQSWAHGFGARATSVTEGNFGLLSSPSSRLRSLADWKASMGKVRTGLLEDSIVYYITERMLASAGADPSRIELVPIVQLPTRLEMLLAGKIEAACLPEPLATMAAAQGAHRLADSDGMGTIPGILLFTKKALAEKQRDIAAFYRAYDAAVQEVNDNAKAYTDVIVAECQFPPAVKSLMQVPQFSPAFLPPQALVADVAAWMKQKGLVDKVPTYADIVQPGYAAENARTP